MKGGTDMPTNVYSIIKLTVKIGGAVLPIITKYISDKELNKMVARKVANEVAKQMNKGS